MVSLNFTSWNQFEGLLRQVDVLRRAADSGSDLTGGASAGLMLL